MVWPLREPFSRWNLVVLLVLLVSSWSDLFCLRVFSHLYKGFCCGCPSVWFTALSGQIFWISRSELDLIDLLEEDYSRSEGNLKALCRSQGLQKLLESGDLWKVSWHQLLSVLAGVIMVSFLAIIVDPRNDCVGICGIYLHQNNRRDFLAFLFQYQVQSFLLSKLISRLDLGSFVTGFDFFNFGLIWQLRVYKVFDRALAEISLASQKSVLLILLCFSANLSGYCIKVFLGLTLVFSLVVMSQSSMLGKQTVEKSLSAVVSKLRIKIPSFDNSALIASYSKTVIGRCMNPMMQDMKALLFMFPRFWQMEGRVIGSDLGLGKFQFDFESEEDISTVLKMEPFHFDHWMVSMVKWEPTVDPDYPSSLTFWIRAVGVPIQFRAALTLKSIGDALGEVVAVDLKGSRMQVILDGFKPLVFDTIIEFGNGEETPISLWYEKLQGYCSFCFSLCHDEEFCEKKHGVKPVPSRSFGNSYGEAQNLSYKAALNQDRQFHPGYERKGKGILSGKEKDEGRKLPLGFNNGKGKGNQGRFQQGDPSTKHRKFTNYAQKNDHRSLQAQNKVVTELDSDVVHQNQTSKSKKLVRKSLAFEDEGSSLADQKEVASGNNGVEKVPTGQISHHSDLELGEINPVLNDNSSMPFAEIVSQGGLGAMDPESAMESEDETAALDRVLKEMEEAIAAGEIIPIEELVSNEEGSDSQKMVVEELKTEEDLINSDLLNDSYEITGNTSEVALVNFVDESESDIGKKKGEDPKVTKRRPGKGVAISGVNSRKRNVQTLISPRKRPAPKGGPIAGSVSNPKDHGPEKGGPGGSNPPKP